MTHYHFAHSFREAAPYIQYLRGKTIVIGIASKLINDGSLNTLATDFNLIAALGVRLVLVHGSATQIDALCGDYQHPTSVHQDRRITDKQTLQWAQQACGQILFDVQAALSLGFAQSPQKPPRLRLVTGNFLTAKPLGVIDGIDMQFTGQVRKVDAEAIRQHLDHQAIVMISPLAISPIGQAYNLAMHETAQAVAVALQAEKLIFLTEQEGILDKQQQLLSNLTAQEARALLAEHTALPKQRPLLQTAIDAVEQGVARVQILSGSQNGSLIQELFTREGSGTSIARSAFMRIREAQETDIADIIALIRPLEERGILLYRSQSYLEQHIREFSVLQHDEQIYGCVALKTFSGSLKDAELACLVVSEHARKGRYGDALLAHIMKKAQELGKSRLFALSTQTTDWFLEHGFQAACLSDLPLERQQQYHESGRYSKIFVLDL